MMGPPACGDTIPGRRGASEGEAGAGRRGAAGVRRGAVAALRRIAFLLERAREDTYKVKAYRAAAATLLPLDEAEVARHVAQGTLTDLPGIGRSTATVVTEAVRGQVPARLARLEAEQEGPLAAGGRALRAALRGDLHSHSDWSDGGSPIEEMAFTALELGHEYLVLTDHSPRLRVANGLSAGRLARQLDVVAAVNAHLAAGAGTGAGVGDATGGAGFTLLTGIEVDILDDGSLDQSDEMLARLDVRVASVHSKLRMDAAPMTRRMLAAVANPFTNVLGTARSHGHREPRHASAVGVRRACGVRGLRGARHGGRDQLPPGASRSADGAARARPRRRLPVQHRLRLPRPGAARHARLRLRAGGGGGHRPVTDRQHLAPRRAPGVGAAMSGTTGASGEPEVEVRRSRRRRRTVAARREGEKILVLVPAAMTAEQEAVWVPRMVARVMRAEERRRTPSTDADLEARARWLSDRYLGGLAQPASVRWVENQTSRWGPARRGRARSGCRAGCGRCRGGSSTTCWCTSWPTCWSPATTSGSGGGWSTTR